MGHPETPLPLATLDTFGGQEGALTVHDIQRHIQLIQQVLHTSMKRDTHYGIIPGTRRMSLWKPGAELILATFRLGAEPVSIEEGGEGFRVTLRIFHIPSNNTVGYGLGSCSWAEDKYAWRKAVNAKEYDAAAPNDRRVKHYKDGGTTHQVHTNPADQYNTALKMAKKRALVDACLTCTAASDAFDQDLDTVPAEENGHKAAREEPAAGEVDVDASAGKLLRMIEVAENADQLVEAFDAINELRNAKLKVSLMSAYKVRLAELGPEATE